jgi:hypothetical protein
MTIPQYNPFVQTSQQSATTMGLFLNKRATVTYIGQTTDANAKEIFIDGVSNYRLQPPQNSHIWFDYRLMGYKDGITETDFSYYAARGSVSVQRRLTSIALLGTDVGYAASSSNPYAFAAVGTVGNGAFTVNNGTGSDSDYLILTVTGGAFTVNWLCVCDIIVVSNPFSFQKGDRA